MLKDIKQIDKFKAFFRDSLSDNGDYSELKIVFNKDLKKVLKDTTINEVETFRFESGGLRLNDEDSLNLTETLQRYKVKRAIFSSLMNNNKECLFIKELIDTGKYTFKFNNIPTRDRFKEEFKQNLFSLLRLSINEVVEQTLTFKINPQ